MFDLIPTILSLPPATYPVGQIESCLTCQALEAAGLVCQQFSTAKIFLLLLSLLF